MTKAQTKTAIGIRLRSTDPIYSEILDFLVFEAELLDDDRYPEWLELLADDVSYEMPARQTVHRADGEGFDEHVAYYRDDRTTLGFRTRHNSDAPSAWTREPPSRTHRLITNVTVQPSDIDDEYFTKSSILLLSNRFDQPVVDILAAKRSDIIRLTADGPKLVKRTILIDQTILAQPFGNLFL